MKVLLIYPPVLQEETYSRFAFAAPTLPPLGLAYLASALLQDSHEVKILDCIAERISLKQLRKEIDLFSPSLMGVTSTTITYPHAKEVIKLTKSIDRDIVTVLGGPHITALPEQTMKEIPELDIGVLGEGEESLQELVLGLEREESLENIKGLVYRKEGATVITPPRPFIIDIDKIPFPARGLFKDLKLYSHTPLRAFGYSTSVITSRGCPFNCHYCDKSVFGRKWRAHSPDYVIKEISMLKERYGIDYVSFEDDNFAASKKRVIEICKKMIDKNLNLRWGCSLRADSVDEELTNWMKKAGCCMVYIGIESGSQDMLNFINKKTTLGEIRKAVDIIKKSDIQIYGSFIIGLPKETKESLNKTIDFALSLPLTGVSFNLFTPYPNTKLRELAEEYGTCIDGWERYSDHSGRVPYIPEGFTEIELLELQKRAYRKFFLRPRYIMTNLNKILDYNFFRKSILAIKALF